jgi:hypothetical protein
VTALWSIRITGDQVRVPWQLWQLVLLGLWLPGLPVAALPLWQLLQPPVTEAWSKRAVLQLNEL